MEDWSKKTDDDVWGGAAGEQPGSQAAYQRELEQKRRLMLMEKDNLAQQQVINQQQIEMQKRQLEIAEVTKAIQEQLLKYQKDQALSNRVMALFSAISPIVVLFIFLMTIVYKLG